MKRGTFLILVTSMIFAFGLGIWCGNDELKTECQNLKIANGVLQLANNELLEQLDTMIIDMENLVYFQVQEELAEKGDIR